MNRSWIIKTVTAACLTLAGSTFADDWTRFRGPNGSGLAPDSPAIPAVWTERDQLWKTPLPGAGHSSPVIASGKLFVTAADPKAGKRSLICLDASSGSILWTKSYDFAPFKQHQDNNHAAATPAIDAQHVYAAWPSPERYDLVALDHQGNEKWTVNLGKFVSQHGNGASPIVVDDLVVLANDQDGPDASVVAVEARTGQVKWKVPRIPGKGSSATPCLYTAKDGGKQVILASSPNGLTGLDAKTGKIVWQLKEPITLPQRVVASPIVAGDLVIASCGEGANARTVVAVKPGTATEPAKIAWRHDNKEMPRVLPYVPSYTAKDNLLFAWSDTGGTVTCMAADTGKVLWQEKTGGDFYASPVCLNNRLYNLTKSGEVVVINASDKYELLGRIPLNERTQASAAVANGKLYLRTLGHVMCIGK